MENSENTEKQTLYVVCEQYKNSDNTPKACIPVIAFLSEKEAAQYIRTYDSFDYKMITISLMTPDDIKAYLLYAKNKESFSGESLEHKEE